MKRNALILALEHYQTDYPEESNFIPRFISLLCNFHNCFKRNLITGHITASAFITDQNITSILLTHHKKLNRWLQPGGHADGMEDIRTVAFKEGSEETGLSSLTFHHNGIFDIDIHQIPYHAGVHAHFHYDIRFLFVADKNEPLHISDESHDLAWIPINKIAALTANNHSILRMSEKLLRLFPKIIAETPE